MTNLLVTYNYPLSDQYLLYCDMTDLCIASFTKFLANLDQTIVLSGKVNSFDEMLRDVFRQVREIWSQEPHPNILLVDSDCLAVKPLDMFGKFKGLTLFGFPPCKVSPFDDIGEHFYMYAAVRYLNGDMDAHLWDVAQEWIDKWDEQCAKWGNHHRWGYDQYIWNQMYWKQDWPDRVDWTKNIAPEYTYDAPIYGQMEEEWMGGIKEEQARIMHFSSSRGIGPTLEKMKSKWESVKG